jgi:uncharacterized delta-60 repeat protein
MNSTYRTRTFFIIATAVFLVLSYCFTANATGNEIDLTFNAVPSKDFTADNRPGYLAIQPDGKIIVFGDFQVLGGTPRLQLARLNSNGGIDSSFNPNVALWIWIESVVVQPDGKILVAGGTSSGFPTLNRLNSDGSVDGSFAPPWLVSAFFPSARVLAVQADGKIFAARHGSGFHITADYLYRLNSDGSVDPSFTYLYFDGWGPKHYLNDLKVLSSGKLLIGGNHTFGNVFRVNSDGTRDTLFESPLFGSAQPQFPPIVNSIAMQSDGKVLFTGSYATVNGLNRTGLSRLNADGTFDLQFPQTTYNTSVRVLSNDKILVGEIRRLNSDGTLDNSYNPPSELLWVRKWQLDGMERFVFFGGVDQAGEVNRRYGRLNTDGSFDLSVNTSVGIAGSISAMAVQTDGRVLLGGQFDRLSDVLRTNFGRVNPDGSNDSSFNAGTGFNNTTNSIVVQADGKIVVGGFFSGINGAAQGGVARLNADGSHDAAYDPVLDVGVVYALGLQTGGKVLIGGVFSTVDGVTQKGVARLNTDGSLDTAFSPLFGTVSISAIAIQNNGKIMIGGSFNGISGVARSNIARLNADGTVDTTFNAGGIGVVTVINVQLDGKYLTVDNGLLKRLNSDGSLDNTFPITSLDGSQPKINRVAVQTDGAIIIGGAFNTVNGITRPNFARLTSSGQVDGVFFPNGTNGEILTLIAQPDGKVLIGGSFTLVNDTARAGVARLNTVPFRKIVNFDYDGDDKADVSVYRPSNNYWYLSRSSDSQFIYHYFGAANDIPTPADFDGDGKTDLAIFRPSNGDWWYQSSINTTWVNVHWGSSGDIPRPSDIDGDGRADYVVYRESNNRWYRLTSGNLQTSERYFGAAGDKPIIGDFDGDGKSDPAIFRPSTGVFWYMSSIDSVHRAIPWGAGTDIPAPADYDGDGKTDAAVYRPSTGYWYIYFSSNGSYAFTQFGISEDKPVPADYDGDGKADIAVYRPSVGTWYILRSTAGFAAQQFGNSTDVPTPNAFVPPLP